MKPKIHFTDNYLLNPTHPVTVSLIGCGGTGSQVLTALSRINYTLRVIGHPGLHVTCYDPDQVSASNIGRQLFSESDIGLSKAVLLISRVNRFFSTGWDAIPEKYKNEPANIIITCVDNIQSRIDISSGLLLQENNRGYAYKKFCYWLDFGNTKNSGQVVLGSIGEIQQPKSKKFAVVGKLPYVTERYDFSQIKEKDSGPSCSLAEAIEQQDLFINSTLANVGSKLLWKLFREGMTDQVGCFINMDTLKMNPIML